MRFRSQIGVFLLLILVQLTIFNFSYGQSVLFSPSPIGDNGFDNVEIIGQDDDGFYLLQSNLPLDLERDRIGFKSRKYKIAYYSFEMALRWVKPVEAWTDNSTIEAVTFFHQKILIIASKENKSERTFSLFGQWMNNKGDIISNTQIAKIQFEDNSDYAKAKIIISSNQQLACIIVHEYFNDNRQAVHTIVADTSMEQEFNKKLIINYSTKKFTATGYSISNAADFNLIGVRTVKDKGAERKRQEDFILFSSPIASDKFSEHLISEGNKEITGASISFDNINRKIVCTGFYADRLSSTGAGIIYATAAMNDTSQLIIKTKPIDSNTQIKLLGERNSGYDIGLVSYPIQNIILRNDGGAVIIAEASYTTDYAYYDYFTQSYTRRIEYHFNNIVAISVNANGSIHWLDVIRKSQESEDDGAVFSSFGFMLSPEEIILIYNSDISRSSEVVVQRISNTGMQKENKPVPSGDRVLLLATSGKQVSENEIIIPCISRKKLMLVKFIF